MSLSQTVAFDTAANFTYDANLIAFASGKAKLKPIANPSQTFTQAFASGSGFTLSDTDAIEVAGGVLRQKNQSPAGATFGAKWAQVIDASIGGGSLVATPINNPVITGGKLDLTSGSGVTFAGSGNFSSIGNQGTVKFKLTLNYDGNPATNQTFFTFSDGSNNIIQLVHLGNGNLFLIMTDLNGVAMITNTLINFPGTSGVENELELSWDLTGDQLIRVFGGGFMFSSIDTSGAPFIRNGATSLQIGDTNSNFFMGDFLVFDSVQHTANYTPGYSVPEKAYVAANAALPAFSYAGVGDIEAFVSFAATVVGAARFTVNGKYWNGSAWATSDGTYAQASTAATVTAHLGTLTASNTVSVTAYFTDSDTLNSVDDVVFGYTGEIYPTSNPYVTVNSSVTTDSLEAFETDTTVAGSDAVRFAVMLAAVGGVVFTPYYWNGSAWVVSNGSYSQTNTAAEILAHCAALDIHLGKLLKIRSYLHSADGSTTPEITSYSIDYGFIGTEVISRECIIYGWILGTEGEPIGGSVKAINKTGFYHSGNFIGACEETVTADPTTGYWEVSLIETASVGKSYNFEISTTAAGAKTQKFASVVIPNQDSVAFKDIATIA